MSDTTDRQPEPLQPALLTRLLAPGEPVSASQLVDELDFADRATNDPHRPYVIVSMTSTVDGRTSGGGGGGADQASRELVDSLRSVADAVMTDDGAARLRDDNRTVPVERDGRADLRATLTELAQRHQVRTLLCEAGAPLSAQLLGAGLVDELFMSLSPTLVGGDEVIEAAQSAPDDAERGPVELKLLDAFASGSHLFLRYGVRA